MSPQDPKSRVVADAIRVEAANTVKGPAAVTISIEVDSQKLSDSIEGGASAERAFVMVPRTVDGQKHWTEEELLSGGVRLNDKERLVETFSATVSGPTDVERHGVAVGVQTPGETVWARPAGERSAQRDANDDQAHKPSK